MEQLARFLDPIVHTLGPWPTVGLIVGVIAIPFVTVLAFFAGNLRLGPVAIELRKATKDLDELSVVLAESRIVELDIAAHQFVTSLSESDKQDLRRQVQRLKDVLAKSQNR
ncbi:MAG: hypothetical protein QM773_05525 [Hyphomonadaceae bacterium]